MLATQAKQTVTKEVVEACILGLCFEGYTKEQATFLVRNSVEKKKLPHKWQCSPLIQLLRGSTIDEVLKRVPVTMRGWDDGSLSSCYDWRE